MHIGTGAFTVTPFGLRVTLPVFEVTPRQYIAFLGCSRNPDNVQELVCLTLQKTNPSTVVTRGQPAIFHCSWPNYKYITASCELVSKLKWNLRDIHISLRPAYREGAIGPQTAISRLMACSPERPYQLKASFMKRWAQDYHIVLLDVRIPPLPWDGYTPATLLFRRRYPNSLWITLTLGRCIGIGSDSSTSKHSRGTHYAAVRFYSESRCPNIRSFTPLHRKTDHLCFSGTEWEQRLEERVNGTPDVNGSCT